MIVTIEHYKKGMIIQHKPTGNSFSTSNNGGYVHFGRESYIPVMIYDIGFVIEGRRFLFEDCELSRLNFTECPHCKKLF